MSEANNVNPFDEPKPETVDGVFAPPPSPPTPTKSSTTTERIQNTDLLDEVFARFSPGEIPSQRSSL